MKKILLVEDDTDVCETFKQRLEQESFQVEVAYEAKDGLQKLSTNSFDLVVTDIIMPSLNGIELSRQIKEKFPEIPVIVCSSGGETGEIVSQIMAKQAQRYGSVRPLIRPFTLNDLVNTVKNEISAA